MEENSHKVVVITGATKGLGAALAHAFARKDYEVVGLYHADLASAAKITSAFAADGLKGSFLQQDVTAEGDWAEFDEIMTRHEGKNISLIANASSLFTPKPMHLLSWNDFSSLLEVNVKGAYLTFRRLLPLMLKASSRCTFISVLTSTVIHPAKGFTAYVTAKSALHGLTCAIACEYEPRGIRAFSVSPAFMETSLNAGWGEHLRAAITANAKPQDPKYVAATILALAESNSTKGRGENYPI